MNNRFIFLGSFLLVLFTLIPSVSAQRNRTMQTRGPMFITSFSFQQGISRVPYNVIAGEEGQIKNFKKINNISLINVSQFMGFQLSPYFAVGLGVGFEYWTVKNAFVPIYADLRFNMIKGRVTPHVYLNIGYANRWQIDSKPYKVTTGNSNEYVIQGATSGIMSELGIGVKASVGYSSAIVITVSAKMQESAFRYYSGYAPLSQSMKPLLVNTNSNGMYLFFGIKAGFIF
ncbi:MAG: hypothetical protein LBE13_18470 [Bacteroidales bacterium]|jgi:hypothetical protein|nr:hypothetical protein [Bacteroidales bacterium]